MNKEQLYQPAKELRVQTSPDGSRTISGYAIRYNEASCDLGGFTELVAPGAVTASLRDYPDVLCLRDHRQELLMGRTKAGTLTLTEDSNGLRFVCRLPDTTQANDLAASIDRGDLDGVSFGFTTLEDKWTSDGNSNAIRTLLRITLHEVSPTSFPAYSSASVSVRSCPPELRSLLRSQADADDDDCPCGCDACSTGDCDNCTDPDFDHDEDRSIGRLDWTERTLLRIEVARRK